MSRNIITGIDIGTVEVKAVSVVKSTQGPDFELLAKTQRPSLGMRKGVVINPTEVAAVISECLKEIELQTNQKIEDVYVNINGSHLSSSSSKGLVSVSRADQKISSEDIERVVQAAKTFPMSKNKEIIDVFPQEYIIDGVRGIKDPLEMQGIRFEAEVLIVEGYSQYLKNTSQSILDTGLQVNDLILGILSAGRAVLNSQEKERGVAVIDIGAHTTALAVFEEGDLLHLVIFPIGAGDITNDVAIGLKTDIETAEKIKREFGSCLITKGEKKREKVISLKTKEEVFFSKLFLRKIINARVSEIFDLIKEDLKKISKNELLPAGLVLTGGGSLLSGISDLAKKEFNLPCRIGFPLNFIPPVDDPKFAVACGLVISGHENNNEENEGFFKKMGEKVKRLLRLLMP